MTREQDRSKALQIVVLIAPPVLMALTGLLLRGWRKGGTVAQHTPANRQGAATAQSTPEQKNRDAGGPKADAYS